MNWKTTGKIALGAAGAGLFAFEELYRYIFCRKQPKLLCKALDSFHHEEDFYRFRTETDRALRSLPHEVYSIRSERGEKLVGYFFPTCGKPTGKIAFVIHGYHSNGIYTAGMLLDYYRSRGFDIFCVENTTTRPSGGEIVGYDYYESADCLKWLDYLVGLFGEEVQIVLHGFSLGAATVSAMSDRCPPQVKFGVVDSGYTSAAELLKPRLGPLYAAMNGFNRLLAGYSLEDTDVRPHVKNSVIPLFYVHGTADATVPYAMSQELSSLCGNETSLLIVEGAGHIEPFFLAQADYSTGIDGFIAKFIH